MILQVAVEGDTDVPIVRKLAADAGFEVRKPIDCAGKSGLDPQLPSYNNAAKGSPWLVLRDLDHDARCAPELLASFSFTPNRWMCFRIAVRELESWILADAAAFAKFYGVPTTALPDDPDAEDDPTKTIVDLVRHSRHTSIRRAVLPTAGASVSVGKLYESTLIDFGKNHWSVARASQRSDSLRHARRALRRLAAAWEEHIGGRR